MSPLDEPDRLVEYLYGELAEEESGALADDPELDAHGVTLQLFRSVDLTEPPPSGLAQLAIRAAGKRPRPWSARLRRWLRTPAVGVAAASALVLIVFVGLGPQAFESEVGRLPAPEALEPSLPKLRDEVDAEDSLSVSFGGKASELSQGLELEELGGNDALSSEPPERPSLKGRAARTAEPSRAKGKKRRAREERGASTKTGRRRRPAPAGEDRAATGQPSLRPSKRPADADASAPARGSKRDAPGQSTSGGAASPGQLSPPPPEGKPAQALGRARSALDGRRVETGRALIEAAMKARDKGQLADARRALQRAAAEVYRLPLLGEVLLLRAEVELQDQQYTAARTFAQRAERVTGFTETGRARAIARRARDLEDEVTP